MGELKIIGFSDKDIPPPNDPKWDDDNGIYRIVYGQPTVRIPFIKETGLKFMSLKNIMKSRINITNKHNHDFNGASLENKILYTGLVTSDAIIGNPEEGDVKIIHNNPLVYNINQKSNFVSWAKQDPDSCKNISEEEINETDRKHPSGYLEISKEEYKKIDGLVIKLKDLNNEKYKKSLTSPKLIEKFFDYLLEGDRNILKEYVKMQQIFKPDFEKIPITLHDEHGLVLMSIAGIRWREGLELSSITPSHLIYLSSNLATQHTEESKKKDLESKKDSILGLFG